MERLRRTRRAEPDVCAEAPAGRDSGLVWQAELGVKELRRDLQVVHIEDHDAASGFTERHTNVDIVWPGGDYVRVGRRVKDSVPTEISTRVLTWMFAVGS